MKMFGSFFFYLYICTKIKIMKIFKNLKIGDKIYVGVYAEFIYNIKLKNGYIGIQTNNIRNKWLYIPYNHINSNKVKLKNGLF